MLSRWWSPGGLDPLSSRWGGDLARAAISQPLHQPAQHNGNPAAGTLVHAAVADTHRAGGLPPRSHESAERAHAHWPQAGCWATSSRARPHPPHPARALLRPSSHGSLACLCRAT